MRYLIIFVLLLVTQVLFSGVTAAAVVKVETDFNMLRVGDVFTIDLEVDTEGQVINAVEAELIFPADLIDYMSSDDGASALSLWLERPASSGPEGVRFSGIAPGGFSGSEVPLLTLTFKVVKVGQGNIEINSANLLVHDGLGTSASVTKQNLHIAVNEGESNTVVRTIDDESPESFTPEIIQDEDVYDGEYALIFATEDKGSGLAYFAVKEGRWGVFKEALSPYRLEYQTLDKKISIKAVDRVGNERIEVIYPQNWRPWYEYSYVVVIIVVLCVLVFLLWGVGLRRLLKK